MFRDVGAAVLITSFLALAICAWIAIVDVRRYQQRLPVRAGLKRLTLLG